MGPVAARPEHAIVGASGADVIGVDGCTHGGIIMPPQAGESLSELAVSGLDLLVGLLEVHRVMCRSRLARLLDKSHVSESR